MNHAADQDYRDTIPTKRGRAINISPDLRNKRKAKYPEDDHHKYLRKRPISPNREAATSSKPRICIRDDEDYIQVPLLATTHLTFPTNPSAPNRLPTNWPPG